MNPYKPLTSPLRRGVTIIEVLFAMGIILVGLVGVASLLPVAGRDATNAIQLDVANRVARSAASALKGRGLSSLDNLVYFNDDRQAPDDTVDRPRRVRRDDVPVDMERFAGSYWGLTTGLPQSPPPNRSAEFQGWRPVAKYIFPTAVAVAPNVFNPPPGPPAYPPGSGEARVWQCSGLDGPGFGYFSGTQYSWSYPRMIDPATTEPYSKASEHSEYRSGHMASFCIDSRFLSEASLSGFTSGAARSAYHQTRFPYFSEWYQPLAAPNAALGSAYANPSGFPHPRMWRAGFGAVVPASGAFIPAQVAAALAAEDFAVSMHERTDKSKPMQQVLQTDGDSATKRQSEQRFSWIATLVPADEESDRYELTVVVIDRRVIESAADLAATSATTPLAERLCWAADPISFGSSSLLTLYGSASVSDEVRAGQWMMLSRQPYEMYTPPSPPGGSSAVRPAHNIPAIHQWVRIASVGETELGPFGGSVSPSPPVPMASASLPGCWRREVIVDASVPAPAFADGLAVMSALAGRSDVRDRLANQWHATIVDGAVAVSKSQVFIDINQ